MAVRFVLYIGPKPRAETLLWCVLLWLWLCPLHVALRGEHCTPKEGPHPYIHRHNQRFPVIATTNLAHKPIATSRGTQSLPLPPLPSSYTGTSTGGPAMLTAITATWTGGLTHFSVPLSWWPLPNWEAGRHPSDTPCYSAPNYTLKLATVPSGRQELTTSTLHTVSYWERAFNSALFSTQLRHKNWAMAWE